MPRYITDHSVETEEPMSFLLYGKSGTGKSFALKSIDRPILYIRHPFEPSHSHFKGRTNVVTVELDGDANGSCWDDFQQALKIIPNFKEKNENGVVVIDSMTALSRDLETYIKSKNKGRIELKDWGFMYDELFRVVRICKTSRLHCVVILWADVMREKISGVSMVQPKTRGGLGEELPHYFSETIYAFTSKDKNELKYLWQHRSNDTAIARTMVEDMPEFTDQNFNIYFK